MAIDGENVDLVQNSSGTSVPSQVNYGQGQGIDYNHWLPNIHASVRGRASTIDS
uniref:Uncharacterized protein n=1 Tax=Solanum tuberosum TaxID=4113 RepID=M1CNI1_SOLTU